MSVLFRRRHDDSDNENLDRWLLTYADMITLLLAFFVVMYSISQVDSAKFRKVTEALTAALDGDPRIRRALPGDLEGDGLLKKQKTREQLLNLQKEIEAISRLLNLDLQISTELQHRGLVIHISESAFFDLGKADLKPEAAKVLDLLAAELLKIPNHIRVEGHTDNLPIKTARFPSNWELSTARAASCLRYLVEKHNFPANKISALGYAEYRPIAPNTTAEGRSRNRRVDIVVLTPEDIIIEPVDQSAPKDSGSLEGAFNEPAKIQSP